jgi:diguanylate cyclase (GGDEF)-like protein
VAEPAVAQQSPFGLNRRLLVIDDDAAIHAGFRKVLNASQVGGGAVLDLLQAAVPGVMSQPPSPQFEVDVAFQGQEGVNKVQVALQYGRPYALAFVDMRMPPGFDGLRTIELLWKVDPAIQIVICSAQADYEWSAVAARLNFPDRLLVLRKPFEPIEVQQCASALCQKWHYERLLRGQVKSLEKMVVARTRGLEAANRQLRHMATHDALTGLPNRTLLEDRMRQAISQAQRNEQNFAVLVGDLNRFKLINDSMGHHAGDIFLQEISRRLASCVREGDTLARLGGDEFVFVLNSPAGQAEAEAVSQRAQLALAAPMRIDGIDIHASVSFGVAIYPRDGTRAELLLAHADAAMYSAKQHGGGLRHFNSGIGDTAQFRLRLESDLHRALSSEQFELHYQPKVDTQTGIIRSAEALLRWRHPERGDIPPADFIPIVEETGQIGPIGNWVLKEACRQTRIWQQQGLPQLRIAVNISAIQFHQPGLVEHVTRALREAQLDPCCLEVELTESCVMSNAEESIAVLEELSRMGVMVSIDDFGTGYSSMSYLRRLPIDKLKIDRTFVAGMAAHVDSNAIVQAIISLAHSLRLKVIAEGVETGAQLETLKAMGCDQYQGFLCSPAVPAGEFARLLRAQTETRLHDPHLALEDTCSKLAVVRRRRC